MFNKIIQKMGLARKYNEIYDVLQKVQNKKNKPQFNEKGYKCSSTNNEPILELNCDEGKILKYILKAQIKYGKAINKDLVKLYMNNNELNYENFKIMLIEILNRFNNLISNPNKNYKGNELLLQNIQYIETIYTKYKNSHNESDIQNNNESDIQNNNESDVQIGGYENMLPIMIGALVIGGIALAIKKNMTQSRPTQSRQRSNKMSKLTGTFENKSSMSPKNMAIKKGAKILKNIIKKGGSNDSDEIFILCVENIFRTVDSIIEKINIIKKNIPLTNICVNNQNGFPSKCEDKDYDPNIKKIKKIFKEMEKAIDNMTHEDMKKLRID